MDGTIIGANENFLSTVGYSLDEIKGKHHSMFVTPADKGSAEYQQFWENLKRGKYQAAEYKRLGKGGKEVWIQASYNPIMDLNGKPFKVVKFATDITQQKMANADFSGQVAAISKAQAVIEFNLDGMIITANPNFLGAMGYQLDEIKGRHHSMFVEPSYKDSVEYREFWRILNDGKFQAGEYKRFGKGGKEIWIQASYNPIFDLNGKPFKVVKYATDITMQKVAMTKIQGIIDAANNGDLSSRIDTGPFQGFYLTLASNLNQLMDTIIDPISKSLVILQHLSEGDLTRPCAAITRGASGKYATRLTPPFSACAIW